MKLFGTVFFALTMFFLAYVLLADSPTKRINRGCQPVSWVGTFATTAAAIFSNGAEQKMQASVDEMFQGCRFFMFRQFYAEELAELARRQREAEQAVESAVEREK